MSLLSEKRDKKREEDKRFKAASKRAAFTSVVLMLLLIAVIAVVALLLFYTLNCPVNRDAVAERSSAVESYSLIASSAGGCVGSPLPLFTDGAGSANSVIYLLGNGEIKPWQYVGDSPIYLHFHQGGILNVHLVDSYGNFTRKTLGDVTADGDASLVITLPAHHWHAWEPENKYPLIVFSVLTASGSPDFSQHPLVDIFEDPILSKLANQTETEVMIRKFSTPKLADYCQEMS